MDIVHFLNSNQGFVSVILTGIQALSTIILVAVTAYYAFQSHATVREMSKQRKDSLVPVVVSKVFFIPKSEIIREEYRYCMHGNLKNIGNGPALDVTVEIYRENSNKIIASSEDGVGYIEEKIKTAQREIHFLKKDIEKIKYIKNDDGEEIGFLTIKIFFRDLYDDRYVVEQEFVCRKKEMLFQPMSGSFRFYPQTKEMIDRISKETRVGIYH